MPEITSKEFETTIRTLTDELAQLRAELSAQSEIVQRDWLSPVEATGLRAELAQLRQESKNNFTELEAATAIIRERHAELAQLRAELAAANAERDEARKALHKLEFVMFPYKDGATESRCPVCGSPKGDKKHSYDTDCWLRAALDAAKEAGSGA